jgi:hypothetical protein
MNKYGKVLKYCYYWLFSYMYYLDSTIYHQTTHMSFAHTY